MKKTYSNKVIVHVEDEEIDRRLFKKVLDDIGFAGKYLPIDNGITAKEFLEKNKSTNLESISPDIVFLDINLPGISGYEILGYIRDNDYHIPPAVIMMSGSNSRPDYINSIKSGANGYILKNKEFKEFAINVENLVSCWLNINSQKFI